jgi:hypothetical protein
MGQPLFPAQPLKWGGVTQRRPLLNARLADESIRLVLTTSADGFTKRLAWYIPGSDDPTKDDAAIVANLLTTRPSAFIME